MANPTKDQARIAKASADLSRKALLRLDDSELSPGEKLGFALTVVYELGNFSLSLDWFPDWLSEQLDLLDPVEDYDEYEALVRAELTHFRDYADAWMRYFS